MGKSQHEVSLVHDSYTRLSHYLVKGPSGLQYGKLLQNITLSLCKMKNFLEKLTQALVSPHISLCKSLPQGTYLWL